MTTAGASPPGGVPTLTEVVAWPGPAAPVQRSIPGAGPQAVEADIVGAPLASAAPVFDEEQVAQRVLANVQRQVDLTLEYRMREALTPLLARLADSVVREARAELSSALRDVVERAVELELARHRGSQVER